MDIYQYCANIALIIYLLFEKVLANTIGLYIIVSLSTLKQQLITIRRIVSNRTVDFINYGSNIQIKPDFYISKYANAGGGLRRSSQYNTPSNKRTVPINFGWNYYFDRSEFANRRRMIFLFLFFLFFLFHFGVVGQ